MSDNDVAGAGFVLLHGAGLAGWIWDDVGPYLVAPSLAPDLPALRGGANRAMHAVSLDDVVRTVVNEIADWGRRPLTLVGHSLGGSVALAVAARVPTRVSHLVFVGAAVPRDGEPSMPLLPPGQRAFLSAALRVAPRLSAPGHGRGPWSAYGRKGLRRALGHDLDDETAARVVRDFGPAAPRLYTDPVRWGAVSADTPRTYVKLRRDHSGMSFARQEQMIANLGAPDVRTVDSGHLPMLSRPGELADILNAVAAES